MEGDRKRKMRHRERKERHTERKERERERERAQVVHALILDTGRCLGTN